MYILDEVDAALDLSHTQHIGHLFRTRFHGSQFIVVSLKEGLVRTVIAQQPESLLTVLRQFTNANVLFRTRFRDGTSIWQVSSCFGEFFSRLTWLPFFSERTAQRTTNTATTELYRDAASAGNARPAAAGRGRTAAVH